MTDTYVQGRMELFLKEKVVFKQMEEFPRVEDGGNYGPVWVIGQEFGQEPVIARCYGYKLRGQEVRFYLDREYYQFPEMREMAEEAVFWMDCASC